MHRKQAAVEAFNAVAVLGAVRVAGAGVAAGQEPVGFRVPWFSFVNPTMR